ncbi:MAG TPA: outer membrane protein assembly factor BamA [Bacteroidia bacterium]|nr:outer membrane protein assembly factor BamA [Bacteroidia bacterium]
MPLTKVVTPYTKFIVVLSVLFFAYLNLQAQTTIGEQEVELNTTVQVEYEIGGIVVYGTDYLDKNVIILSSGLAVGDKIFVPGESITKAIKSLWDLNLFSDISISAEKVTGKTIFLSINVEERPRLTKFSFKGVKKGDADDIREKIKLNRGKIVTDNLIVTSKNTIKEFYVDNGYLDVQVDVTQTVDTSAQNGVILLFKVDKKKKVKIEKIYFEGNKNMVASKLKRTMKETKEKHWYNIFKASKYIEENYESDKEKIIAKYNAKGYRDAQIEFDTVYNSNPGLISIKIKINEGPKYYFRNISWVGNSKHSTAELNALLGIKKGDIYSQAVLDARLYMSQDSRDVTSLYMDDGYLFFQIQPTEVLVEHDSIDIEMRIYEGKQATINKVTVVGNTKTNDKVILREIRTKPGQLFSRADIIRTQRELAQLRYFNPEKLGVNPKPNPVDGTVDIEYVVEEQASDQLELSGGWGANRLIGTLGVSFNNFSAKSMLKPHAWRPVPAGDGQALSVRAQTTGRYYSSLSASFTEPWLGGKKPNSFSTTIYHNRQNQTGLAYNDPLRQTLFITGISFGLGKRLKKPDDYFTLFQELNIANYQLRNFRGTFTFSDGQALNASYKIALSRNSIDQPIYPRTGSQVTTSFQFTPPYSKLRNDSLNASDYYTRVTDNLRLVEYYKYKFTTTWYLPLDRAKKLVLMTKLGFAYLGAYNKNMGFSPFERFYLGGSGLTGFALDGREIIALRGYVDQSVGNTFGTGSVVINKYSLELRYPLSLNPSATIYVLGFADAGNAWVNYKKYNPFDVVRGAGAGVRVFLPMFGLLGLDYGWGFDKVDNRANNGNGKGQFHFTIGANIGDL